MSRLSIGLMEPVKRWEGHYHPLGLMYISSYLEKHGYENYIINKKLLEMKNLSCTSKIEELILKKIKELKLDILGISCALNETNYILSFCKTIKKDFPKLKIVIGGPMPSIYPELFLKSKNVDFVVRGEGEKICLNLFRTLEHTDDVSQVRGISYRKKDEIIHNPPETLIEDINSIPMPSYEKVDMSHYTSMHEWVIRGIPLRGIFFLSSRGCPFHCSFCGAYLIHGNRVRFRSQENIYIELKFLKEKYKIESVFFCDDTLTINMKHLLGICEVMKELNILWSCFSRVDNVKEDLLRIMKKSGCIQLDFGVESGSDRILRMINKGTTVKQAEEAFKLCHKYKMRTFANLMIGLPTETAYEMYQTFNLAKRLHANSYVVSIAMPIPGTELWDMVNPRMKDDEYDLLNWHGESFEITDRCNKSNVPTRKLIYLHNHFLKVLQQRASWRTFINYNMYLIYIIKLDSKLLRMKCTVRYLLKQIEPVYRIYLFFKNRRRKKKE